MDEIRNLPLSIEGPEGPVTVPLSNVATIRRVNILAVPLGLTGVIGMLYFSGTTLNIQSLMGTLMMVGVVVSTFLTLFLVPCMYTLVKREIRPTT